MTLITPDEGSSELGLEADRIKATLNDLRADLEDLMKRVRTGEVGTSTEAGKLLAELRFWLKQAKETEALLDRNKRDRAGIARDYALDLDVARLEVGCRLGRLRTCCREGAVSE